MMERKLNVLDALTLIASVCDGAITEDGVGFNKFDSPVARYLIVKDYWSDSDFERAKKLVRKYRNQLLRVHGVSLEQIDFKKNPKPYPQPQSITTSNYPINQFER